jgi:hypothetical protein
MALFGVLVGCSEPEARIVHQDRVIELPASSEYLPGDEAPLITVRMEADAAEVARSNRSAYVECRSSLHRVLEFIKNAAAVSRPDKA